MKRSGTLIALAAVATLSAGSIGIAAASSAPRTFKACADKHGTLSLLAAGHCGKGTSEVRIGSQGPTGKTGSTGATGAQGGSGTPGAAGAPGGQGPAGPSDGYTVSLTEYVTLPPLTDTTIMSIANVPPGSYLANASVDAYVDGHAVYCGLVVGATEGATFTIDVPSGGEYGSTSIAESLTLTAPTNVGVECEPDAASNTHADVATLNLIKVGTLHGTADLTPHSVLARATKK